MVVLLPRQAVPSYYLSLASCYDVVTIFPILVPMASFSRGQLRARQTKVVDESQRPLKTVSPWCGDLRNVTSSKPCSKGRDVADDSQGGACVVCCGSKRCKRHVTIFL